MKFMQIKPQKARGVLKESMWTDPEWVAEEKFDGDRRIAQLGGVRARYTGTRESVGGSGYVEKTYNLPHLMNFPFSLDGTVLDGEIVAPFAKDLPGGKSKYVTAIMGSKPARAIELQRKHGWLEYMVFDCLWYKGEDMRGHILPLRRDKVVKALKEWGNKYAKLVLPTISVGNGDKKAYFAEIIKAGGEGVILKHVAHTYGDEKLWVKRKGEWTADVVIMDFKPGKGKNAGQVGAMYVGQYEYAHHGSATERPMQTTSKLVRVGSVRGFDDRLMAAMTAKPKRYVGLVVEIAHNGREPTGAFRHPRFKRFRPDKSAKDCIYREGET